MIRVEGVQELPNSALQKLEVIFGKFWPDIAKSDPSEDLIVIYASRKISGYKVSDLDIVIAARFTKRRYFVCKNDLRDNAGNALLSKDPSALVYCGFGQRSRCRGLNISAGNVDVRYPDGWKSATAQNDLQKYALRSYFNDLTKMDPWHRR